MGNIRILARALDGAGRGPAGGQRLVREGEARAVALGKQDIDRSGNAPVNRAV